ncbi:MAG: hypothetical protein COB59_07815 [Rhodospirillaceae bacterium]|nr:MAG: hypothetical protein COB59_07815 [Rhodospirillaceae bacterium]
MPVPELSDLNTAPLFALSNSLQELQVNAPDGVSNISVPSKVLFVFEFKVRLPANATVAYKLQVEDHSSKIVVKEIGGRLPQSGCPTRHINEDLSLCIGYEQNALKGISNVTVAKDWWVALELHLRCQEIASVCKTWPKKYEVSHGDASTIQMKAETLAGKLGLLDDYRNGLSTGAGRFGEELVKIRRGEDRPPILLNLRGRCPCGYTDKCGRGHIRKKCPRQKDVAMLVKLEWDRRKAEKEFWKPWNKRNAVCCGTMKDCPLRLK